MGQSSEYSKASCMDALILEGNLKRTGCLCAPRPAHVLHRISSCAASHYWFLMSPDKTENYHITRMDPCIHACTDRNPAAQRKLGWKFVSLASHHKAAFTSHVHTTFLSFKHFSPMGQNNDPRSWLQQIHNGSKFTFIPSLVNQYFWCKLLMTTCKKPFGALSKK